MIATSLSSSGATVLEARCFKMIFNGAPITTSLMEASFVNNEFLYAAKTEEEVKQRESMRLVKKTRDSLNLHLDEL